MKTSAILAFVFVFATAANAQTNTFANGARSSAMGNAGVAVADVWSTNNNQAALTSLENIEVAAFYKNNFGLSELSLSALSVAIPTKIGTVGGNIAHFGFSDYNENKFSISFAKRLWRMFSLSAAINYNSVNFANGYQNAMAVCGEVGVFARFSDEFCVGAHVYNPTQSALSLENKEKLPVRYKLGLAYAPAKTVMLCADIEHSSEDDFTFRGGIEYYLARPLCIRAGAASNPTLFTLGAGYTFKKFTFDVSYSYHNVLGNITGASLLYKFGKR